MGRVRTPRGKRQYTRSSSAQAQDVELIIGKQIPVIADYSKVFRSGWVFLQSPLLFKLVCTPNEKLYTASNTVHNMCPAF